MGCATPLILLIAAAGILTMFGLISQTGRNYAAGIYTQTKANILIGVYLACVCGFTVVAYWVTTV